MVRTEAELYLVAVKTLSKRFKRTLKIAECDILIYYKAFALVENRRVRAVNSVGTINTSGLMIAIGGLFLSALFLSARKMSVYAEGSHR